jgi:nickel-dependent lactate racemase
MLPVVVARLQDAGIDRTRVSIVLANGTHPPVREEQARALLGDELADIGIEQHDCRDVSRLLPVGETSFGNLIRLNRTVVESELLITIGCIRHHYFAGFGGGPKMVFPGVAGYEEIQINHSRVIEFDARGPRRAAMCEPGTLSGNPVAEEIAEAASLRPPDLAICTVAGNSGETVWVAAGTWRSAFDAAIERCRRWYEVPPRRFPLAVAGGGGAPSDSTLVQAHKGLDAICRFLEPGGEVLYLAEMGGAAGSPDMSDFLDDPRTESILAKLALRWVQYGHTTLRIVEKTSRFRCSLLSGLDAALAERLRFEPVADPTAVVERWREKWPGELVGVMPGATVFPRSQSSQAT